ncbi:MAG: hypothetical protein HYU57_04420 [Micavibrio aeruginosavorus]|nr:hypothetical protein [Micavibrio aeruginosavorus]
MRQDKKPEKTSDLKQNFVASGGLSEISIIQIGDGAAYVDPTHPGHDFFSDPVAPRGGAGDTVRNMLKKLGL